MSAPLDPAVLAFSILAFVDGTSTHARAFGVPPNLLQQALYGGIVDLVVGSTTPTLGESASSGR